MTTLSRNARIAGLLQVALGQAFLQHKGKNVRRRKFKLSSAKQIGEWAEMQFMARAAANGFTVTRPWGDSARYDFAVERNGIFQRVQVKSTASRAGGGYACNSLWSGRHHKYTAEEIDFLAVLIIPEETWYIIPMRQMGPRSGFYLNPGNRKNRYFRYMEAWHLLKQAVGVEINAQADASQPPVTPALAALSLPPVTRMNLSAAVRV